MTLQEFHREFLESVRSRAESARDFLSASFIEECGYRLTETEQFSSFESCRFEGVSNKKKLRVDGYYLDDADNSVSLLIGSFLNEDEISTFNTDEVKKAFLTVKNYVQESLDGFITDGAFDESQPGYGLACDLMDWQSKITKFRFYYVSDGQLKSRLKDWPEDTISGIPTEFHIWDVARFHVAYISATGRDELVVNFESSGQSGLSCLAAAESDGDYKAYLCMISGDMLADIYEDYGSRLLEGNVRTFLSAKGKVNSKIQNTIKTQPEMFFAFNNGIAATAENVVLEEVHGGIKIISATNLQIVNGGQTTASLALAKRGSAGKKDGADLSKVMVQMKLSVLPPEKAGELTPEIARYANSQNKVSDADFFSNHPYHVRLEEFSRRIFAPSTGGAQHGTHWFYERARGQYLNEQAKLTGADKSKFTLQNPRKQLFSKTDVAKLENTWRELPHKVSMGAQKNFMVFADVIAKAWATDGKIFNEDYYKHIVALAIMFRQTENIVSQQEWYQGGYRANIVTYSLAKLHNMVAEQALGKQLNLRSVWDKQSVAGPLLQQIEEVAKRVFDVLTDPDRLKENVTEWAKMQACWDQVKELSVNFVSGFVESLQDLRSSVEEVGASKELQKTDDGIATQISVIEISSFEWSRMLMWGLRGAKLTPKQESLLKVATQIPNKLPTEKQCVEIWRIRASLIDQGYISL
ncbi:AIPR family protein [Pseudomonas sp. B21-017]|uniref:AIPR family protein n=1 Tax=Pseudomonas sp. B21-017 TaxID=2895474 RepID=UPI002160B648|nr:AIPR family protein [Pseudomonas sp. B21-017]UVM40088.1 AIPR family protein [Pseudomonas sp. B21-017]